MHNTTARSALRATTAAAAICAALTTATGAAGADSQPLRLEPATEATVVPVGQEEYTSTGSSTISATVHAKVACLLFAGNLRC
ncbi:hypothetical protein [Nocardia sp. CNY236]|uniref:hypothetical protein n=1 Tax=Nocardia sp. CNY236 TaxID=1169152 RepID=UPI0004047043|nr:hypothetical protein [Nocardia sp. CNY236]